MSKYLKSVALAWILHTSQHTSHMHGTDMYLLQSSAEAGLNIQSSYMFMTIGLVPMLIGTIAFLPKRRVPWPVPNNYHEMEDSIGAYVLKNSPRSSNTQREYGEASSLEYQHLEVDEMMIINVKGQARRLMLPRRISGIRDAFPAI